MERDRVQLLLQTFKEFNTQYNNNSRRASSMQPPMAVNRVKVTFKDEPGEGSGVARSFYTALAEVMFFILFFYLISLMEVTIHELFIKLILFVTYTS